MMRAIRLALVCVAVLVATSGQAQATLMTFEDVPGGSFQNSVDHMPLYQGFNFNFTLRWIDVVGSGWNFGAHSGEFALLNDFGGVGIITEGTGADFTFDGLWAKAWGTSPGSGGPDSLFGTLAGYNNGALVWSVSTGLNGSYEFYGPQAGAIDELRLGFGNYFLVDDILLNAPPTSSSVPEPTSLAMFGIGACIAAGGAALRRRREKQQVATA